MATSRPPDRLEPYIRQSPVATSIERPPRKRKSPPPPPRQSGMDTLPAGSDTHRPPGIPRAQVAAHPSTTSPVPARKQTPVRAQTTSPLLVSVSPSLRSDASNPALRRKPSTIQQYARRARTEPEPYKDHQELVHIVHDIYDDPSPGSVFAMSLPPTTLPPTTGTSQQQTRTVQGRTAQRLQEIPARSATQTPALPRSTTPSSRYTASPFSHQSTPTSMSSRSTNPPPAVTVKANIKELPSLPHSGLFDLESANAAQQERDPIEAYFDAMEPTAMSRAYQAQRAQPPPNAKNRRPLGRTVPLLPTSPAAHFKGGENSVARSQADSKPKDFQVPPELAHLNVESRPTAPPRRPSRDGTDDLSDHNVSSPVIQSDLPSGFFSNLRRTPSQDSGRRRFGFRSRSSSREPSPQINTITSPSPSARSRVTSPMPADNESISPISRHDSPLVQFEQSSRSFKDKLFSRRDADSETPPPRKLKKRGPAAGTGHEGYGRFGLRRRSSIASATDRSASADSVRSKTPVNMTESSNKNDSGPESSERRLATPAKSRDSDVSRASPQSAASPIPSLDSGVAFMSPKTEADISPKSKPGVFRDPSRADAMTTLVPGQGILKSSGQDSKAAALLTTNDPKGLSLIHPALRSLDSSGQSSAFSGQSTTLRGRDNAMAEGKEGHWLRSSKSSPNQHRKWNFSQRAHASAVSGNQGLAQKHSLRELGHYAMDDHTRLFDVRDLDEHLQATKLPRVAQAPNSKATTGVVPYEARHDTLLPSPPTHASSINALRLAPSLLRTTAFSSSSQRSRAHGTTDSTPRPVVDSSKSPSKAVNTQSRQAADLESQPLPPRSTPLAPKSSGRSFQHSFSRPFRTPQAATVRDPHSPQPSNDVTTSPALQASLDNQRAVVEDFLQFPSRHNSEISYTSSSGAATFSTADSTLIDASDRTWHGDEDVWNEYNEFLDEVMHPHQAKSTVETASVKTPRSVGSSLGAPFQYQNEVETDRYDEKPLPGLPQTFEEASMKLDASSQVNSRRSQADSPGHLSRFLAPAASNASPLSISDVLAGYGDRSTMAESFARKESTTGLERHSATSGYSSHYDQTSRDASRPQSMNEVLVPLPLRTSSTASREKTLRTIAEVESRDKNGADAELRFGALMTSKWLSFGRVLFSPAHNEVKYGQDVRILVIDGLGKDWSYYCALTYPTASFYNLGPESASNTSGGTSAWQSLSNHRHIPHPSISAPFPFPKGFFSAVVLRFPIATTDSAYHACIFECKRVLRAGGYLEISVLDLDMMNMGNGGRKAVRSLKTSIRDAGQGTSLRNLGDAMMKLVGRRGFENIQRCVVGIPAAGCIPRSQDMSNANGDGRAGADEPGKPASDFAHLLYGRPISDEQGRREKDEGIAKMVARVGRWWYSTCYESVVRGSDTASASQQQHQQQHGSSSIWDRPGLIRECEKQRTSLRLLICYAQKPACATRRTVSV